MCVCVCLQYGMELGDDITTNITLGNVSSGRSEGFAAIFLITLFLGLSLGLAVYAGMEYLATKICTTFTVPLLSPPHLSLQ